MVPSISSQVQATVYSTFSSAKNESNLFYKEYQKDLEELRKHIDLLANYYVAQDILKKFKRYNEDYLLDAINLYGDFIELDMPEWTTKILLEIFSEKLKAYVYNRSFSLKQSEKALEEVLKHFELLVSDLEPIILQRINSDSEGIAFLFNIPQIKMACNDVVADLITFIRNKDSSSFEKKILSLMNEIELSKYLEGKGYYCDLFTLVTYFSSFNEYNNALKDLKEHLLSFANPYFTIYILEELGPLIKSGNMKGQFIDHIKYWYVPFETENLIRTFTEKMSNFCNEGDAIALNTIIQYHNKLDLDIRSILDKKMMQYSDELKVLLNFINHYGKSSDNKMIKLLFHCIDQGDKDSFITTLHEIIRLTLDQGIPPTEGMAKFLDTLMRQHLKILKKQDSGIDELVNAIFSQQKTEVKQLLSANKRTGISDENEIQ